MLMQGDLDVGGTGGGGGQGTTAPLTIPSRGQLRGTTASIPLTCATTSACNGTLKLTNGKVAKAAKKKKRKVTVYGTKRFQIPAGKSKRVKVKLNRAGRRKLGKHSKITLTASTKIGSTVIARRVKFTRAKHK
jgi:hypothetical protein